MRGETKYPLLLLLLSSIATTLYPPFNWDYNYKGENFLYKKNGTRRMKNNFLFLILLFLFTSCATTDLVSFKDPAYTDITISRIVVLVAVDELDRRMMIEDKFVEELSNHNISALQSYRIFPPTREFNSDSIIEAIEEYKLDSFLISSIGETGVQLSQLPSTTTTKTKGKVNTWGNSANVEVEKKTTTTPGATLRKPWAEIYTEIRDAENGNKIWIANSSSGGNAFSSFTTVYNSYCEEVVNKLIEDGLICVPVDDEK